MIITLVSQIAYCKANAVVTKVLTMYWWVPNGYKKPCFSVAVILSTATGTVTGCRYTGRRCTIFYYLFRIILLCGIVGRFSNIPLGLNFDSFHLILLRLLAA